MHTRESISFVTAFSDDLHERRHHHLFLGRHIREIPFPMRVRASVLTTGLAISDNGKRRYLRSGCKGLTLEIKRPRTSLSSL